MTNLNELLKHTSRSLYLSARLLPNQVRDAFGVAYLLCRYADSIADTSLLPADQRLHWIKKFPALITDFDAKKANALVQEISSATNVYEEQLLRNLPACVQAFEKIPSLQRKSILDVVHAVCCGMEIDLQTFPNETSGQILALSTEKELENYCHLMGGAPGIFWSELIASTVPLHTKRKIFLDLGHSIGCALQIVNILRDLPRDVRIGRCYFPQTDLNEAELTATDLLLANNAYRFEPIKQKWIAWGRKKLSAAHAYYAALPKTQLRHRAAVAWPILWAADTLNKLEQTPNLLDPTVRVKITRGRIYSTMLLTAPLLCSNTIFSQWLKSKMDAK